MEIFGFAFFRNALIGLMLVSIASAIVGTYVVTRRLMFVTGGITHACFGGLGLGYYIGMNPIIAAGAFAIASALGVEWMSARRHIREDSAISVIWALGMAAGVIFIFLTSGYVPELNSFLFGNLLNSKRSRQAALLQTQAYAQAVRSQLIATVAATYYALLALDEQSRIYAETEASWRQNVSVTSHLVEGGKANSASLSQTQANYYNVLNQLIDIRQQVMQTENSLCSLLGIPPQEISRGRMDDWQSPTDIQVGIPLLVLRQRPDVNQAEQALAQAFYNTQQARSEFFPSITITGTFDFGEMLYNALGSLFQPIFQSGALKANLDIAKAQEKEAEIGFRQTLIDAGIEVNDAIMAVKSAQAKTENYALQVSHLQDAVQSTQLLMKHGSTTYLEVLTAQQSLLSAQISQVANRLTEISSCISLYQALGGGTSTDMPQNADSKKRK